MSKQRGYLLISVIVTLFIISAVSLMMSQESALESNRINRQQQNHELQYLTEASIQHAEWSLRQQGCGPFSDLATTTFGNHSYSATITPNNSGGLITTYNVAVSDDAWINKDQPTQNYGSDATLQAYYRWFNTLDKRVLYRFDLGTAGIPANSQVVSAVARIFVTLPDSAVAASVHQVEADWTEDSVNWDNIQADINSSALGYIPASQPAGQFFELNITALVQGWINGSIDNQGIMLIPSILSNDNQAEYSSKEHADSSQHPILEVKISDGSLSNRADISASGTLANGTSSSLTRSDIPLYQSPPLSLNLQPGSEGKDAEIWDQAPNNNYGDATETWVSSASNDKTRSLLQFEIDTIPVGAGIFNATLSLLRRSGSGADQPVSAHRIKNPWSEDSVSWNRRQSGTNWDTAGSDFDNRAIATTPVGPVNQRYEWDITSLVQGWVNGSYPNYGVVLAAAIDGMPGERFYTGDDNNSSRHPTLDITYSCECGNSCLTPQGSGDVLLVVSDSDAPLPVDSLKKSLFEKWGYTVTLFDDDNNQNSFISHFNNRDVVYVSETVNGESLADKLNDASIGVINEEGDIFDNLGTSSSFSNPVGQNLTILDNSHYITALFPLASLPIFKADMEAVTATGILSSELQILGDFNAIPGLAIIEAGGLLQDGITTAPARRVILPLGRNDDSNFNWDYLNGNGRLIIQRAIQWGVESPPVTSPAKKVYWTNDIANLIQRSDEDGSNVETVLSGLNNPKGLDIDTINAKIYWTDGNTIKRSNLDGSDIETLYSGFLNTFDIKLDIDNGMMYWSFDNINRIMRANLDGSASETINTSLNSATYISLDTSAGHIYLTEFGNGNITRMNLDGSGITTLISGPTGAMGNAIDIVNGKVYWSGGATNDWIKRADLDGSNEEMLVNGLNASQDISYDADNDRIYWGDALNFVIQRANSDGSDIETIVSSLNRPRGILLVDADMVPATGSLPSDPDPTSCNGTYREEFNNTGFSGSDGTLDWSTTPWQEVGESDGASSGDIRIMEDSAVASGHQYKLRIQDNNNGGEGVERPVNLNAAVSATLTFDYRREGLDSSGDHVAIFVSSTGTAGPWTELPAPRIQGGATDPAYLSYSRDISAYISADTAIRLRSSATMGNSDKVWFDNIQIECSS